MKKREKECLRKIIFSRVSPKENFDRPEESN